MTPHAPEQSTALRGNADPARWLFIYAVMAFVIAIVVTGICSLRMLYTDGFPSGDGLLAFAVMLQVAIGHSLFNAFLTISLLILQRWRLAIGVFVLGVIATIPIVVLLYTD